MFAGPLSLGVHKLLSNGVLFIPYTTRFKVNEHLDHSRVFTGSTNTYLVRLIIVKTCEAEIDPKEDMAEKNSTSSLWLSRYS